MDSLLDCHFDHHEHRDGGKLAPFPLSGHPIDTQQHKHQELKSSAYNAPLLGIGSRASSVCICEENLLMKTECQCSIHSDSGYGEGESIRQPNTPFATYSDQGRDRIIDACGGSPQSNLRLDAQGSEQPSSLVACNSPPIDGHRRTIGFPKSPLTNETELPAPTNVTSSSSPNTGRVFENSKVEIIDDDASDSEMGEDGEVDSEDEGEDEEHDWSGQNDDLEAIVLDILAQDLPLAAKLIPVLHKAYYTEFQTSITRKVGPWRHGVTKCATGGVGEGSSKSSSSQGAAVSHASNPRKRQRLPGGERGNPGGREDDNEEDDENGDKRNSEMPGDPVDKSHLPKQPRLACPFHKRDPAKYCVQHDGSDNSRKSDYRTCAGPGFGNIQRLKEHLKRKHYPVQCKRCFRRFSNGDRALALNELEEHNRSATQCELRSASLKEGISDTQWAQLEKKKSTKKDQETSTVEKWYEIWGILFPEVPEEFIPKTPWYDYILNETAARSSPEGTRKFCEVFKSALAHKVGMGDIRFAEDSTEEMKGRVEVLAQHAFELTMGLYEPSSTTNSSSARSRALSSFLGGPFEQISMTTPSESYTLLPAAHMVPMQSQAYQMGVSGSQETSLIPNPRGEHPVHSSAESFSPYVDMRRQGSSSNTTRSGIPNDHSAHSNFPIRLSNSTIPFGTQSLDGSGDQFYNLSYVPPFSDGSGVQNLNGPNMNGLSTINPNDTYINPSDDSAHLPSMESWENFPPPHGYNPGL